MFQNKGGVMPKAKKRKSGAKSKLNIDSHFLKHFCNVLPDPLDTRDYRYGTVGYGLGAPGIPKTVDYSSETGPVGNQKQTGSCVGWACAYGLRRWLHFKATGQKKKFSVRFAWMGSKEYDPFDLNVPFDGAGTRIRDAFKVMRKFGACPDSLWPFSQPLPDYKKEARIKREAEVDRDVVQDTFQALCSLGHTEADARRLLDAALAGKKKFKDMESLLQAVYQISHDL